MCQKPKEEDMNVGERLERGVSLDEEQREIDGAGDHREQYITHMCEVVKEKFNKLL